MRPIVALVFIAFLFSAGVFAQQPAAGISDNSYKNTELGFEITLPDNWKIAGNDFENNASAKGIDVSLKAPDTIDRPSKIQMDRALERVQVLLTAIRAQPDAADNAILRISTEDVRINPAIKDAVDYFDLMRSQFAAMRLPSDFKYSETNAEQLGAKQFAFLDTSSSAGKKRMYATVRNGVAIMFTLSYTKAEDLKTLRDVLSKGNFNIKD